MKKILLGFLFLASLHSIGQNFNMNNGSSTTCDGLFYDSGGPDGNYNLNQNLTKTFYPSLAGSSVKVSFSSFSLEDQADILFVYDGGSVTAPLIGGFTGETLPPVLKASATNTSGALTFRFLSDGQTTMGGWEASVLCVTPCQSIESVLVSTVPEADPADGLIKICPGTTVQFNGDAVFANSGAGATYVWTIGDLEIEGQNITHTFETGGAYMIGLRVTDASGCINTNSLNRVVQTSFEPAVLIATDLNEDNSLWMEAQTSSASFTYDCTPSVPGVTFLPDGSGASYQSTIYVNCYDPGQTLSNPDQLLGICLNMEHSYLGDLTIRLVSPNGLDVVLKSYPGGGNTWLGIPVDDQDNPFEPGTGSEYCFSMDAATTLVDAPTYIPYFGSSGVSVVPGTYLSEGSFSSLVGTPLNGTWTILITDNLAIDNGFIFDWTLEFAPELLPDDLAFETQIMERGWLPDPSIIEQYDTIAIVGSPEAGEECFTYFVTDNFGCTYYYEQCVELEALGIANITGEDEIQLFPSPANDNFKIAGIDRFDPSSTKITITDASGKRLKAYDKAQTYDVSDLQSGIYFITVTDASGHIVKRLIKN
ncbi:PKD domain-containing protein [Flavobacterium silvaticum]|uniref:T9SS type A sorting domain-containing protein n=1 Tax=Flavobacterium silvaticum TaxID=1852020 RepID=A0A972FMK2_9FLAO|nr:PKD domain-containing protein [Flavobacterium silvaticum]NMH28786.1 T9SS type A sorting domain-containing protein [Flavobacterium silvaticum]